MSSVSARHRKSIASVLRQVSAGSNAPMSAMIEVADRCNETCVHCYQIQGKKGELETADWKRVMDELADLGVIILTISGGEATLRRDFLELVAYARKKRFAVKLFTNGLNMTPALARELGELAVQEVQISLYSTRAEVHDWVTRVPGSWQKTVDGARHLIAENVKVILKTPVMTFNEDEIDAYIEFVSSLGADYLLDPQLDPREDGETDPERFAIDDATYRRVHRHPLLAGPPKPPPGPRDLDASVCGACQGNLHVEANGELRPCTQLDVPVGHALRDGVADAWRSNDAGARIRALRWADLPGCRSCDLNRYCNRCFATARSAVGDSLAPYPGACRKAQVGYELAHGVAPKIQPAPDRDPGLGPYVRMDDGSFTHGEYRETAMDRSLADELGWTRGAPASPHAGRVRPGQLVQIRRPGAKVAREEAVPVTPSARHCGD